MKLESFKKTGLIQCETSRYRYYGSSICIFPMEGSHAKEKDSHPDQEYFIRVDGNYYGDLYVFLSCVDTWYLEDYRDLKDIRIGMDIWREALRRWKEFAHAASFDEAFEKTAGVNCSGGPVRNPEAARCLEAFGKEMWETRVESERTLNDLLVWTEQCQNSNDEIYIYFP